MLKSAMYSKLLNASATQSFTGEALDIVIVNTAGAEICGYVDEL